MDTDAALYGIGWLFHNGLTTVGLAAVYMDWRDGDCLTCVWPHRCVDSQREVAL